MAASSGERFASESGGPAYATRAVIGAISAAKPSATHEITILFRIQMLVDSIIDLIKVSLTHT
jgi:hypothetical protein